MNRRTTSTITEVARINCNQPERCAAFNCFFTLLPTTNSAIPNTVASASISNESAIKPVEAATKPLINSIKNNRRLIAKRIFKTFACSDVSAFSGISPTEAAVLSSLAPKPSASSLLVISLRPSL